MKLLIKDYICPTCGKNMRLASDKASIDNKVWRCRSKNPKHDVKISIPVNSIFEGVKVKLNILYFLIFNCFTYNKSINKSYNDVKDLSQHLNESGMILNTISIVY